MKLFANGCSFTHGHKDHGDNGLSPEWAWPNVMGKHFDDVVNLGWTGSSNDRILRTTLDFFDNVKDTENWIAVIQWSDCYSRAELYDEETDTFFGYMVSDNYAPILTHRDTTKFITIPDRLFRMNELYQKTASIRSVPRLEYRLLEQQVILSSYLQSRNIKFLYTAMSASGTVSKSFRHPLTRLLPNENILLPMSHFVNPKTPTLIESNSDFHPNNTGHQIIAKYIINELQQRNYL